MITLRLMISSTSGDSCIVDAVTGNPIGGVIACQLSGGDNGFAPLVHLTLANVEIEREPVQVPPPAQSESPFMGGNS